MLKRQALTVTLSLLGALAALGNNCGATDPVDQSGGAVVQPTTHQPGTHRFLLNDDRTGAEECTANDQGGQDCVWDDGAGTVCSYTVDADGALLEQHCSGEWGSYDCVNDTRAITCTYVSGDSTCTDLWSLEGELVQSDCGYAETVPVEECQPQDDGTTLCTFDDGTTHCTAVFAADNTIVSQVCSDGYYTYDCLAVDGQVLCTLTAEGQTLCQDTYTVVGDPIDLGCESYFPDPPPDREPEIEPDCTTAEDGVTTCTLADGYMTCIYQYGTDGIITFVDCDSSDGSETYDCEVDPADELLHCIWRYGDESCEEIVQNNEVISSTCPGVEPEPEPEPTEPACDPLSPECEAGMMCAAFDAAPSACIAAGSGLEGSACAVAADCAPGLQCAALAGTSPTADYYTLNETYMIRGGGRCMAICPAGAAAGACDQGEMCQPILDPIGNNRADIGVCAATR
ncbi:MAG: hypothetical protein JXR83_22200 [Deltaproteobacteria bacterium]|nr:hypothetical protein [Deltaproteobacteria bacterium]